MGKKLRTIDLNRNFLIPCAQMVSEFFNCRVVEKFTWELLFTFMNSLKFCRSVSKSLFFESWGMLLRIKRFQKAAYKPENTLGKPPMNDLLFFLSKFIKQIALILKKLVLATFKITVVIWRLCPDCAVNILPQTKPC